MIPALPRIATPIRPVNGRIMDLFTKQEPLTDEEWAELEAAEANIPDEIERILG